MIAALWELTAGASTRSRLPQGRFEYIEIATQQKIDVGDTELKALVAKQGETIKQLPNFGT